MSTRHIVIRRIRCRGFTLVETIVFIVVISVGVVGLLSVMNAQVKYSADPLMQKQALAVAEALLEEVTLQPFTVCDPEAWNPQTQICAQAEAMGPDTVLPNPAQTRDGVISPFNNVNDYNGFSMNGIRSIDNGAAVIAGLEDYQASVTVTDASGQFGLPANHALYVEVTVTDPRGEQIRLDTYRFQYDPNP